MLKETAYGFGKVVALALVALVALAVSCAKTQEPALPDDDPWKALTGDEPIRFRTNIAAPVTKTTPLEDIHDNFHVFAFYQPGEVGGEPGVWEPLVRTSNFMYNQTVTYTASSWTYAPVKYWPNNAENTISFWAYSPYYGEYEDTGILKLRMTNDAASYTNTTPGIPEIQFTTTSAANRDLLVSDLVVNQTLRGGNPADGVVPLVFNHIMCKLEFHVKKKDADAYHIYLDELSIQDIVFTNVHNQTTGWRAGFGATGNITVYEYDGVSPKVELSSVTPVSYPSGSGEIIPIPQMLENKPAKLHVVYSIQHDTETPVQLTCDYDLEDAHRKWERGKLYTYNINISLGSPILFTANVTPWKSEQNGYFVID